MKSTFRVLILSLIVFVIHAAGSQVMAAEMCRSQHATSVQMLQQDMLSVRNQDVPRRYKDIEGRRLARSDSVAGYQAPALVDKGICRYTLSVFNKNTVRM
ncbi:hypothetical protein SAMN05192560_1525 [Methylobacillus rhizosphaerae]|uniref:Uncharacterized protein n=1 Tax=Methylobacillus rhizosphaerae TaxID=551994 RepID=A0A238ZY86_9PROT|nr:hypothetical protein [Methylobacillus rhizosphaerae]SNR87613.1 hypothetical protein SAMN05192560_1525 [Methylobacillus rhizosphaerae]